MPTCFDGPPFTCSSQSTHTPRRCMLLEKGSFSSFVSLWHRKWRALAESTGRLSIENVSQLNPVSTIIVVSHLWNKTLDLEFSTAFFCSLFTGLFKKEQIWNFISSKLYERETHSAYHWIEEGLKPSSQWTSVRLRALCQGFKPTTLKFKPV